MKKAIPFLALMLPYWAFSQPIYPDLKTKKFGIYDPVTSEPVTPNEFDAATPIYGHDTLAIVQKNGRLGVLSVTGRTVVPLNFEKIDATSCYLEHGFITVEKGGKSGKWQLKTGRSVLPTEFEYVRGIFPNLIATRRMGSETIEFYNEKGKKQFETTGKTASRLFDGSAIEIQNAAGERKFLTPKGQPLFSEKMNNGIWTDGQFVVLMQPKTAEQKEQFALVSMAGDTLLSYTTDVIQPKGKGRFIVKTTGKDRKSGLYDAPSAQWILPLDDYEFFKLGEQEDPDGALWVRKKGVKEGHNLYDAGGKLLLENCQFSTSNASSYYARMGDAYRPYHYFDCQKINQPHTKGFFAGDGRMIVPMEFDQFQYRSEVHAVIASRMDATTRETYASNAFDLKTGQKWFADDFETLLHTASPSLLWAKKEGKWGLIERSKPTTAKFEYQRCIPLSNGYFQVEKKGKWSLFNPKGQPASNREFDAMMQPDYSYHLQFKASHPSGGRLVAFALENTKRGGWWAITDKKQHFFIKYADDDAPGIEDRSMEEAPPILKKNE